MHSLSYLSLLSLAISSFFYASQASPGHGKVRVSHLNRNVHPASNSKRDSTTGDFTYYVAGLGACGTTNTASDYIVALNSDQWDGGSHCYEMISLSYGGKTVTAQVTDECPTCSFGQLDLTYSLFAALSGGDPNVIGEMNGGTWSFADGSSSSTSTSSTSQYTPPSTTQTPTSTSTPPPSTTSSSSSSTQSTSSWTSTSSSSSSATTTSSTSSSSSSSSSASASPSASAGPQVLAQLQLALIQLGEFTTNAYLEN
ncbi:RlpA-like double-psi beta-barrel-protein domain-containing protein-containing protein [Lentinula aff. detonsa]|uniref:RlpA-like double-psi beta-barrel-protein domain-containing protein-containing protein n=1 Tax=Lentinula aff. detonsa TaxID=2804958 RepID=A0AA38KBK8_9AGAR|nr:RlpA-like double-psi beta-barrel-protein domain-containing protein-containing protein [Lentinula aff. detonsa]